MATPANIGITIEGNAEIAWMQARLALIPRALERVRRRVLRGLMTWVRRQALRAAAQASGASQKTLTALVRFVAQQDAEGGIAVWIGTSDLKAHYIGTVRWNRRMKGARAGRRIFPGTWSWGRGVTGPAIMRRTGTFAVMRTGRYAGKLREQIEPVLVPIHEAVLQRMRILQDEIQLRYEREMLRQINYELDVVARR